MWPGDGQGTLWNQSSNRIMSRKSLHFRDGIVMTLMSQNWVKRNIMSKSHPEWNWLRQVVTGEKSYEERLFFSGFKLSKLIYKSFMKVKQSEKKPNCEKYNLVWKRWQIIRSEKVREKKSEKEEKRKGDKGWTIWKITGSEKKKVKTDEKKWKRRKEKGWERL